jgi:hypothetical protein
MWETYFLAEKAVLIGLLSFLDRGSVLQSLVGVVVSNFMLMMTAKATPYLSLKTNLLSIFGQTMICAAYYSSILLRIDLQGELISHNTIGAAILVTNIPMAVYFVFDTFMTMRDQLHEARIGVLREELGGVGAVYRCIETGGVVTSKTMRKLKPEFDVIHENELITATGQAILFQKGGAVGRLQTATKGWVSYNHHGTVGLRHFVLVSTPAEQGDSVGSLWLTVQQKKMKHGLTEIEEAEKGAKRAQVKVDVAITDVEKVEAEKEVEMAEAALQVAKEKKKNSDEPDVVNTVLVTVQHAELLSAAELQAEVQEAALREELADQKFSVLQNRARQAGVDEAEIAWATDQADALGELADLIVWEEIHATIDSDTRIGIGHIEVTVNGVHQKTSSTQLRTISGCEWNGGSGETIAFVVTELETVSVKAFFTETGGSAMLPAGDGTVHPVGVANVNLDAYLERDDEWAAVFREDTEPFTPVVLRGELGEVGATIMSARDLQEMQYQEEKEENRRRKQEDKEAQKALRAEQKALKKASKKEEKATKKAKTEHEQASAKKAAQLIKKKAGHQPAGGDTPIRHVNPLTDMAAAAGSASSNAHVNPLFADVTLDVAEAFPSEHKDGRLAVVKDDTRVVNVNPIFMALSEVEEVVAPLRSEDLPGLSVSELRSQLRARDLPAMGLKRELVARLQEALELQADSTSVAID